MKKTIIKALSVMLAVVLTLTAAPLSGFVGLELPEWLDFSIVSKAAEPTSGTCGDSLTWVYDTTTYTLTISGTGAMYDYDYNNRPWESYVYDIKTVVIGYGVTVIGNYAFYSCNSLTGVTIGESVTTIGKYTFENCPSLISVTIPDSVTSIGDGAFYSCYSLTSVTIPDSATSIGDGAFAFCYSLKNVTIPDNVTTIGNYAFAHCTSLTNIGIPDGVNNIGYWAFYECSGLTSIDVSKNNTAYTSVDGVLFNKDKTVLIQYSIGNARTSYTIPYSVINIYDGAFAFCYSLKNVTIPDSVTSIEKYAFSDCDSLTSITIPDGVTTICDTAFGNCTSLTSVIIPDSVTTIGEWAFSYCDSLASVTIPDSVTTIGERAFAFCYSLNDVYYDGTEEQWYKISTGWGIFEGSSPQIHFNSTGGGNTNPENPDTNENKYIGIVTTEHSLTVGVKEKFKIAFNMIENGKLVDNWKKMSVVVSNPSIISLSDYKETDHGFMLEVTGKEPGVTNVVVTDTETGINTTFEIGVYDEYGQTRTYDMKNMPLFTKGFSKIPTSIYNMNGLYINNFDYKEDGEYYNVTFDVYNKQCGFGAVDIFDENGVWVGCEKIEPNKQIESMWDWLEESYYLITDVATGKFIEYTSEFFSKKTEIDIKVPKGGYFNITNNADTSRGVQIYLFCEIFTKAVGKILPALGVEATEDQFMRDIVGAIVAEAYQDAALEAACSTLTKETIKIFTKFTLSNVIDTSVEMVNIFENFLNALDISWKHIAKMTVSGAESVLSKTFTSIGTPLKAGFTASEITNWYEIYESTKYSMDKTYASIYTDMDNIQNIDGIEVITNGKIDVDTALQVFKIYNNKSAEANANGEKYELYNISFVKNDKTVQPSGLVEVRIPIPKGMKKDTCEIHRQEKDGSWTILTARVEGNYLVFETDHFSLYMITGDMYSLNIQSLPDKLTYTQGEVFDSTGLVLELNGEYITEGLVASPSVMETVGTQKVQIHYGAQFVEIDVEVIAPEPEYNYSFYIQEPSRTEIRNKDTIVLHAIIDGNVPEGSYIEWDMSEGNFSLGWDSDTDVYATAEDKGWDTITAILYDADGNELARDSVELYSKSGFFDKIGGFFRMLFGTTKTYDY